MMMLEPIKGVREKAQSMFDFRASDASFLTHRFYIISTQAARRDQNRIAQREFRLRKQQRVSVLSIIPFVYRS
jgi:hypothetical protein